MHPTILERDVKWKFHQPVNYLERIQKSEQNLSVDWSFTLCHYYSEMLQQKGAPFVLENARGIISSANIEEVLGPIRNKLLDFMLTLRRLVKKKGLDADGAELNTPEIQDLAKWFVINLTLTGNNNSLTIGDGNIADIANS